MLEDNSESYELEKANTGMYMRSEGIGKRLLEKDAIRDDNGISISTSLICIAMFRGLLFAGTCRF